MQFTSVTVTLLACAAFAAAMPAYGAPSEVAPSKAAPAEEAPAQATPSKAAPAQEAPKGGADNVAIGNGSGNDNDSSKICDAANNGRVSCCDQDSSSDGGILGLNGLLGGSCELTIHVLDCQNTQTQACCPTSNQTGLIPIGSICVPISL
ncbi:hypothetical protein HII31_04993 [Pseudocercospora fuligena]|uniref:Hydrophobin n=1 Tax=Pseudocercospora fuligena TaxID=685502 RepID=A0A8H6VKE9_9PEZI|nr:hypothetical protein HII31_04993 [Pseudocercospora fuligena]